MTESGHFQKTVDNLTNLDMEDPVAVRNRLMTFLCYDTALRIGEVAMLRISDLQKDAEGEWCLLLKPESQKGREKPPITFYFYFEKTKELLEHYLANIRRKFHPRDESLFLSIHSGKAIKLAPCLAAVRGHLAKYGVTTCYGKKATAHHLRHSFGTLNIEPLGVSLPAHEVSYRYRHTRLEITMRVYVHNNPELIKLKHKIIQKRHKKSPFDILDSIPLAELDHWLGERLGIPSDTLRLIRKKHREALQVQSVVDTGTEMPKIPNGTVDSSYVRGICGRKDVSFRFLKQYCLKNHLLVKVGRQYRFNADFISDLEENWLPVRRVMEKLSLPKTSLYRAIEQKRWPTLKLGKKLLLGINKLKVSVLCN